MRIVPLAALACATFALGFGELMLAGILPAIAAGTGTSIALTGQLVTVYALTFALLSAPLTIALRARPAKSVLIAALLVVAVANAVAASSHAFALLIVARIVAAAGSSLATPLALSAIDWVATEDVRGRAHGIVFTGFSLAAMLGVPLGALVAAHFGWHWTFAIVSLLAAGAAAGIARTIPAGGSDAALAWPDLRRSIADPALRRTLFVSTIFLTGQYTAFTYFRPYFGRANGDNVGEIAWLFFVYGVFGIAGTLIGGWVIDRSGTRPALLLTLAGCALTLAALPLLSQSQLGSTVAVAAWALTSWGFAPAVNRQLDRDAGDARDVALALNLGAFNLGIAAGSALGGVAITLVGISSIPLTAATLCALAFIVALRVPRMQR